MTLNCPSVGAGIITSTFFFFVWGGAYYDYSIMGPKTLC